MNRGGVPRGPWPSGGVIVDLVGATGVGKSTIADRLLGALSERGQAAISADDFVGRCYGLRLGRVPSAVLKSLVVDLLTFPWFLRFAVRRPGLCWFVAKIVWRDIERPLLRLNVLRNIVKRMGARELMALRRQRDEVIVVDEGLVHQAHSLFVHPRVEPRIEEIARFVGEVPMPDLLVLVEGPTGEVARRTVERGHQRLPGEAIAQAGPFVERAQAVFRAVLDLASRRTNTIVVQNGGAGETSVDGAVRAVLDRLAQPECGRRA